MQPHKRSRLSTAVLNRIANAVSEPIELSLPAICIMPFLIRAGKLFSRGTTDELPYEWQRALLNGIVTG